MSTELQKRNEVRALLKTDQYQAPFREMLKHRAPAFISSIIAVSQTLPPDTEPRSIIASAATAATLDLPVNKSLGYSWIVPYAGKAQFQIGWKGYVQLAQRTGQYKTMNADRVYEGELTAVDRLSGEPTFDPSKRTGDKVVGYFFYFKLLSGFEKITYWSKERVEAHMNRYSKGSTRSDSVWKKDFDGMALKTVVMDGLRKWGIMSAEMQSAYERDQTVADDLDAPPKYVDNPERVDVTVSATTTESEHTPEAPDDIPMDADVQEPFKPAAAQPSVDKPVAARLAEYFASYPFEVVRDAGIKHGLIPPSFKLETDWTRLSEPVQNKIYQVRVSLMKSVRAATATPATA